MTAKYRIKIYNKEKLATSQYHKIFVHHLDTIYKG